MTFLGAAVLRRQSVSTILPTVLLRRLPVEVLPMTRTNPAGGRDLGRVGAVAVPAPADPVDPGLRRNLLPQPRRCIEGRRKNVFYTGF